MGVHDAHKKCKYIVENLEEEYDTSFFKAINQEHGVLKTSRTCCARMQK